jgi:hypothetical protein
MFRVERIVYLTVTLITLCILLGCAVLVVRNGPDVSALVLLVGSSGGIVFTAGRLLHMFDRAIDVLGPFVIRPNGRP